MLQSSDSRERKSIEGWRGGGERGWREKVERGGGEADLEVHLVVDEVVPASPPLASLHCLTRLHHVLSHALRGSNQRLPLAALQYMVQVSADHAAACIQLVG